MNKEKPIYFYVANLGSEIQRVFVWKEKGDKEAMDNAYKRSLSIIDIIKSFGNVNANIEMDMLSSFLVSLISDAHMTSIDRNQLSLYFNPFALRVLNPIAL